MNLLIEDLDAAADTQLCGKLATDLEFNQSRDILEKFYLNSIEWIKQQNTVKDWPRSGPSFDDTLAGRRNQPQIRIDFAEKRISYVIEKHTYVNNIRVLYFRETLPGHSSSVDQKFFVSLEELQQDAIQTVAFLYHK